MSKVTEFVLKNLTKSYDKNLVLDVAQLSLKSGQFVALMGKNGSGKSTIMRLLAQQELYDSGDILLNGKSLSSASLKLNPQTVFISEEHELPFKVGLNYWVESYKRLYPVFDQNIFSRLIQSFELDIEKSFHGLSRGQKMKALFCLQAPKLPDIYLLDEVTAVLDVASRWTLMEFLREEIMRGCLVVMSTNIANEMQGFATDLILLEKGRVKFSCPSNSLRDHFMKIRISDGQNFSTAKQLGARRISFNGDGRWTYMYPKKEAGEPILFGVDEDKREITIADVQSYFTAGESIT